MYKYLLILLLAISSLAKATVPIDSVVTICNPYPEINDPTSLPEHFNTTNNLARPKDSAFYDAEGEIITIYGRVMDSNCFPVSDAKIYIWQANKEGYVQYPIKTSNNYHHHQKWLDPNFTGTGITNSDNLGRFNFTTIKPGSFNKITPHIHVMIEHPKLKTLSSKFYFLKERATKIIDTNEHDHVFTISDKDLIAQVTAIPGEKTGTYMIDITMDQELKGKKF